MKITSNTIGNYGPAFTRQVKQTNQTAQKSQIAELKAKQQIQQIQQSTSPKTEGINNDEKEFFINLYPENSTEIVDYHFYQKTGKMSGVSVGSIIDRRG